MRKLAGAGFILCLFSIYLFFASEFDLFEFSETMSTPFLWAILYGYGILSSILIDFIEAKFSIITQVTKTFLYVLAGFGFFLFNGLSVITVIAGTVGAFSALIFYLGTNLASRFLLFRFGFSLFLPALILMLMSMDFTEKKKWNESTSHSTYTAEFEYFNGKHEIPIPLEKGQSLSFSINLINSNGGGHGLRVEDDKNQLVGLNDIGEERYLFKADHSGEYNIIVKGDQLRGSFTIVWEVLE